MSVVETEKRDRVFYVTLNRPEAKNAINQEVHRLLCAAWEEFGQDDAHLPAWLKAHAQPV